MRILNYFVRWFIKFFEFSNAKKSNPVLILGRSCFWQRSYIIVSPPPIVYLTADPWCGSHKANQSVLRTRSEETVKENPETVITVLQLSTLYGEAFLQAQKSRIVVKGFEETGFLPTNINVFNEDNFWKMQQFTYP